MDKLKMHSLDGVDKNIEMIGKLFPNVVTERKNENGEVERAIDFDILRQELSKSIVEGNEERYQFTWPDKKKSILLANSPIAATLRPCREESVNFDTTENLYIEGDNLDVLKLLQETYLGKVKMIYIDPPYNTGNDFVYEDDFSGDADEFLDRDGQYDAQGNRMVQNTDSNGRFHTDWLNMIYPRLKVAKDLLTEDGVIFISIDDHEVENITKICNEVFGESNHIETLVWKRRSTPPNDRVIGCNHEYILIFAKDILSVSLFLQPRDEESTKAYINLDNDPHGVYRISDLSGSNKGGRGADSCVFPILDNAGNEHWPPQNKRWLYNKEKMAEYIKDGRIGFRASGSPFLKRYLSEVRDGITLPTILTDAGTSLDSSSEIRSLFQSDVFDFPKTIKLLKIITKCGSADGDIVMDFFSGSCSSAHSIIQLNSEDNGNRKFIMVQLPELTDEKSEAYKAGYKNICEIGKERIRRAGKKIYEQWSTGAGFDDGSGYGGGSGCGAGALFGSGTGEPPKLDIGFRVLKLDSSNMKDIYYNPADFKQDMMDKVISNIKEDRTPEDLLFQVMLELGVLLSSKIEETTIVGKKVFSVADNFLIACFDEKVTDEVVKAIAQKKPYYAVLRDSSLADDSVATNFDQIFATYSPDTVRRVL